MPNVIIIAVFQRVVAQGLAHLVRDQGVGGSNPLCPTRDQKSFTETSFQSVNEVFASL